MITNKDIRVDNGNLILNGDKYPLDGQSPEAIMQIVEDNSDSTPTENSTAPITSGGVFAADKDINDTIGDITQTGVSGATVAAQIETLNKSEHYEGILNYSGHFDAYKYGNVVNLKITGVVNATLNDIMTLTSSLPIAIRPLFDVDAVGYYNDTDFDSTNNGVNFRVLSNGTIRSYSYKAFTAGVLSVTYISAS